MMTATMATETKATHYIVKLTTGCNLRCDYCYYGSESGAFSPQISEVWLSRLINEASQLSARITFTWHGGEPLLAGLGTFQKILTLQQHLKEKSATEFENHVQTNGVLINEDWARLFKEHNFRVGVSLDGPEDLHCAHRHTQREGDKNFRKTLSSIEVLRKLRVPFGVLAVVSKQSLGRANEICEFFAKCNIRSFEFLPCTEFDPQKKQLTSYSVTPAEYGVFMCEAFDWWVSRNDPKTQIVYLLNVLVGLLGGRPSKCRLSGTCGRYVTVNTDGSIWPCDRFVGSSKFCFGNLRDNLLKEVLNSQARASFLQWANQTPDSCSSCRYMLICRGGCRWRAYQSKLLGRSSNIYCEANQIIFDHVDRYLTAAKPDYHPPWLNPRSTSTTAGSAVGALK